MRYALQVSSWSQLCAGETFSVAEEVSGHEVVDKYISACERGEKDTRPTQSGGLANSAETTPTRSRCVSRSTEEISQ